MTLLLIWLIPAIPAAIASGIDVYKGPHHPKPGAIAGGNKRTATGCGIVFGLAWPALLVILIGCIVAEWFAAGAPDA